jgi:ATP-dependent DNA helicase RecQ
VDDLLARGCGGYTHAARDRRARSVKRLQARKLDALLGYCETVECRRHVLLGYFGEAYPAPCPNCDNCLQAVETWDGTVAAQKALSCVYRTGQRFGAAHLTDILVGHASATALRHGHDRIKTFGAGQELPPSEWRSVFRQLAANGLLTVNLAEISGFRLTENSWPVLKAQLRPVPGAQPLKLRAAGRPRRPPARGRHRRRGRPAWLRRLGLDLSPAPGGGAYVVFDKT